MLIAVRHDSKALNGRKKVAQGKAAQQPPPWVKDLNKPCFFRHSPRLEANDEKSKLAPPKPKMRH
jgi:hypothetical protein